MALSIQVSHATTLPPSLFFRIKRCENMMCCILKQPFFNKLMGFFHPIFFKLTFKPSN